MCFSLKQEVRIDNCDIVLHKGDDHQLVFLYNVTNLAGIDVENELVVRLLQCNNNNNCNGNQLLDEFDNMLQTSLSKVLNIDLNDD